MLIGPTGWTTAENEISTPIFFKGQSGDLVIPLGAYPRWLLGKRFREMTLAVQNPACATRVKLSNVEFLRLNP